MNFLELVKVVTENQFDDLIQEPLKIEIKYKRDCYN